MSRSVRRRSLASLLSHRSGGVAVTTALAMPALLGFTGMGTEVGLWLYTQRTMQGAADSAALGAATAVANVENGRMRNEALGVAAQYGFANGAAGASITVNSPPQSGRFVGNARAVEVVVSRPQARIFTALFASGTVTLAARAVALSGNIGSGCVLALDKTAKGAITAGGTAQIDLNGCSIFSNSNNAAAAVFENGSAVINAQSAFIVGGLNTVGKSELNTIDGTFTGVTPAADPYADLATPTPGNCSKTNFSVKTTVTLDPGTFCSGVTVNSGATLNLNPGVYVFDRGSFTVNGGATVTGTGVTLVFTSSTGSDYATATINGGATVTLTAPTSGDTKGMVMIGDRNAPVSSKNAFIFNGGSTQNFTGALYLPTASVTYTGGSNSKTTCTQLVADTITYGGNAVLANNCAGSGTKSIGAAASVLVE